MLSFCWSHAVSRKGHLSVKEPGPTITVTLPFRNRSDISPVLQRMLQILPSSPGADLRFVGPECYTTGQDRTIAVILAKRCIELPDNGSLVIRNMLEQF